MKRTESQRDSNGRYINPWPSWTDSNVSFRNVLNMVLYRAEENYRPDPLDPNLIERLPIKTPIFSPLKSTLQATWLGHASVYFFINNFKVLSDPIFSNRCSASQWVGPSRYRPPACQVNDLPEPDIVMISHNHYDHLDSNSITQLARKFKNITWLVPDGDRSLISSLCNDKNTIIIEMKWWDVYNLEKDGKELKITFVPVQHWSGRNVIFDKCKSLWGGYVIESEGKKIFFAGDTGYCEGFKEIGQHFNGIDLSAIPIGAYFPRDFFQCQHVDPFEAAKIHKDVKSRYSFGIHWGTFPLTFEAYDRPIEDLKKACSKESIAEKYFRTIALGDCLCVPYDEQKEAFIQEK